MYKTNAGTRQIDQPEGRRRSKKIEDRVSERGACVEILGRLHVRRENRFDRVVERATQLDLMHVA